MNKFVHIGYPKNLSTSLQRSFFSRHPEIEYLGIARGGVLDYFDATVNAFFEQYAKYCRRVNYEPQRKRFIQHFADIFLQAKKNNAKAVVASSEHLSFAFTADQINTIEKVERLYEVFGSGTKILVFLRNQKQLLRSIYREGIRGGYSGTFEDYVKFLYRFQDRNFVADCEYDEVLKAYVGKFGPENIFVFVYENYLGDDLQLKFEKGRPVLISDLLQVLEISDFPDVQLEHCNYALSPGVMAAKRRLNLTSRHDLGNELWNGNENHRLGVYFANFLECEMSEAEVFHDVAIKRDLIKIAMAEEEPNSDSECLSPESQKYWNKLMARFMESNERLLQAECADGVSLPNEYFHLS